MTELKIAANSLYYTVIGLLPVALGFITLPILSYCLSPEEFGILSLVQTFNATISILAGLQMAGGVSRLYFDYSEEEKSVYFTTLIASVTLVGTVVLVFLCLFGSPALGVMFSSPLEFFPYFFVATLTIFFSLPFGITTAFFKVELKGRQLLAISAYSCIFGTALTIYLLLVWDMGILAALLGPLATTAIAYCAHLYHYRKRFVARLDWGMFKENLFFGLPLVPHALGGYLFMYSDKIILDRYVALSAIGIYAIADRFSMLLKTVVNSFASAYSPVFMRIAKRSQKRAKAHLRKTTRTWFILLGIGYYGIVFLGEYAIYMMTPPAYHEAVYLLPILALAYVFRGIYIFLINTFVFEKKTKFLPIATLSSGMMNVVLNLLLIPIIGIYGAAGTTALSFVFNWLVLEHMTKHTFRLPYSRPAFFGMAVLVIAGMLSCYALVCFPLWIKFVLQASILLVILLSFWCFDLAGFRRVSSGFVINVYRLGFGRIWKFWPLSRLAEARSGSRAKT